MLGIFAPHPTLAASTECLCTNNLKSLFCTYFASSITLSELASNLPKLDLPRDQEFVGKTEKDCANKLIEVYATFAEQVKELGMDELVTILKEFETNFPILYVFIAHSFSLLIWFAS